MINFYGQFRTKQHGFSIVEWMIAIMLALFLTAGLLSVFISSQRATSEALGGGERQENASFALQLLTRDLKQAYFFSQATGENKSLWNLNGASVTASLDCLDDISSGSFPASGKYRALWASTIPASIGSLEMDCLDDSDSDTSLITDSDYISIKRAMGLPQSDDYIAKRYYLDIDTTSLTVYQGDASALTNSVVSPVWRYIHHVYYLDSEDDIPRLRRLSLEKGKMVREEVLVEGIESMQFMFALDELIASDRDGAVHSFVSASQVTPSDWDTGRVIGMKISLLVRSLETSPNYTNSSTYQLGDFSFTAPGDGYKREIASTVLIFQNSVVSVDD
ncbi:PilW family protein [Psychromonas ossibalaenae]|uniref:PilW family protein n=1 Tax=Psychromonas ossibalaenae TaxID=444922 RepID=UPI00036EBCEF|nr:PilW family protein [Psychromonas ossibalaenae]